MFSVRHFARRRRTWYRWHSCGRRIVVGRGCCWCLLVFDRTHLSHWNCACHLIITGKLDFASFLADLTEQEVTLVGGRLDDVNGRAVAGLVYKRRERVINVFLWPSVAAVETRPLAHQGYHLVCWT